MIVIPIAMDLETVLKLGKVNPAFCVSLLSCCVYFVFLLHLCKTRN